MTENAGNGQGTGTGTVTGDGQGTGAAPAGDGAGQGQGTGSGQGTGTGEATPQGDAGQGQGAGSAGSGDGGQQAAGAAGTGTREADPGHKDGDQAGQPKVPAQYELTVPDGAPLTDQDLESLRAEATAAQLTQDQATQLVQARSAQITALAERLLTELKADPEIGGTHYDESMRFAEQGRDWLFPPDAPGSAAILEWLDRTGLFNHKDLVRGLARLGREVAEDRPAGGGGGGGQPEAKSLADRLYGSTAAAT